MKNQPIVIERSYAVSADRLWQALTDKEQMKQWYFDVPDFKPEVGNEFTFTGCTENEVEYKHLCKVTELIEGKKISYSWRYDGHPGNSEVTFELFEEENRTRVKLTHAGLETFDPENRDFAKENFVGGWTHFMDSGLPQYLHK